MALGRERADERLVDDTGGKLAGYVSRPHPSGEVEQYVAKDDPAIFSGLPAAKCRRIVTPVDACEHATLGEAVKRVECRWARLYDLDCDIPAALDLPRVFPPGRQEPARFRPQSLFQRLPFPQRSAADGG